MTIVDKPVNAVLGHDIRPAAEFPPPAVTSDKPQALAVQQRASVPQVIVTRTSNALSTIMLSASSALSLGAFAFSQLGAGSVAGAAGAAAATLLGCGLFNAWNGARSAVTDKEVLQKIATNLAVTEATRNDTDAAYAEVNAGRAQLAHERGQFDAFVDQRAKELVAGKLAELDVRESRIAQNETSLQTRLSGSGLAVGSQQQLASLQQQFAQFSPQQLNALKNGLANAHRTGVRFLTTRPSGYGRSFLAHEAVIGALIAQGRVFTGPRDRDGDVHGTTCVEVTSFEGLAAFAGVTLNSVNH